MPTLPNLKMTIMLLIALLALLACGSSPGGSEATPLLSAPTKTLATADARAPTTRVTSVPAATIDAIAPTLSQPTTPPTETREQPTDGPVPPTDAPAPPTPTLVPPDVNTIPGDGEAFDDELPFRTAANDPSVGQNNGDGIESVTFQFFGPDGHEVYSRTEKNPLYCAFGGGDDGEHCDKWFFSEHKNQWPNGKPAQSGHHRLIITIHSARGGTAQDKRDTTLNLNETPQSVVASISPTSDSFSDKLQFQATANDPSTGDDNGAGIEIVTFQIMDSLGNEVHESTDNNPLYCAFGGGDNGQDCDVWRFSEHNNTWPSGTPVEKGGSYRLEVTVKAKSGQQTRQELNFTIQL